MRTNVNLLHTLMETLVSEWGSEEVMRAFENVALETPNLSSRSRSELQNRRPRHAQFSAVGLIERGGIPDEKLGPLKVIAERFDAKTFLPSLADSREFLISMGLRPKSLKDRGAAFRLVLEHITPLPADTLCEIANSSLFSGPARLGPLADAIAEAASSRHSGNHH